MSDWPSGDFPHGRFNGRGIIQKHIILIIYGLGPVCISKSRAVFQSQTFGLMIAK